MLDEERKAREEERKAREATQEALEKERKDREEERKAAQEALDKANAIKSGNYYTTIENVWGFAPSQDFDDPIVFSGLVRSSLPGFTSRAKSLKNATRNEYCVTKDAAEDSENTAASKSPRSSNVSSEGQQIFATNIFGQTKQDHQHIAHLVPHSSDTATLYADAAMTPLVVTLGRTLDPGASLVLTVPYDSSTSTPGTLPNRIRVVVDPVSAAMTSGLERECIESDNEATVPVMGGAMVADLEVELTGPTGDCPTLTFGATVTNRGSVEARDIVVRFYAGDPATGGRLLGEQTIAGPLAPGAMMMLSASLEIPDVPVQIFVVVDPDDSIPECNDGNNVDASADRYGCLI